MKWKGFISGVVISTLVLAVAVGANAPILKSQDVEQQKLTPSNQTIKEFVPPSKTQQNRKKRHTIKLTLTSTDDLKVNDGDIIQKGHIISDRTKERERLEARKKQLELSIEAQKIPLPELLPPTPPNYNIEINNVNRAKFSLNQLANRPEPAYRFKTQELREVFDRDVIEKEAQQKEKKVLAAIAYEQSLNQLQAARDKYERDKYQYSLELTRRQINQQEREFRLASLTAQLQNAETELGEITTIRSPYAGKVRRVRILGQNNLTITAELIIDVEQTN